MLKSFTFAVLLTSCCSVASPALANEAQPVPLTGQAEESFAKFKPVASSQVTTLDWSYWNRALEWFVFGMGPSLRQMAPTRSASIGTRSIFGHNSRYRLEGNRVAFQFLRDDQREELTEYREDLERIASEVNIASLPRNEQLAFWINLHNVAMIEQIALAYPVMSPSKVEIGGVPLDEAKFISVAGVVMSPKDIRTRIVYPNWSDPRVIYGFFRGDIGGPSISRQAYQGKRIAKQLANNATEFVNALRGVDRGGSTMRVSRIYEEAQPFYFKDFKRDLRAHIADYADTDVRTILASTSEIEPSIYETDIADLSKGEREPIYSNTDECATTPTTRSRGFGDATNGGSCPVRIDIPLAVQRFDIERREKIARLIKAGRIGSVTVQQTEKEGTEVE